MLYCYYNCICVEKKKTNKQTSTCQSAGAWERDGFRRIRRARRINLSAARSALGHLRPLRRRKNEYIRLGNVLGAFHRLARPRSPSLKDERFRENGAMFYGSAKRLGFPPPHTHLLFTDRATAVRALKTLFFFFVSFAITRF